MDEDSITAGRGFEGACDSVQLLPMQRFLASRARALASKAFDAKKSAIEGACDSVQRLPMQRFLASRARAPVPKALDAKIPGI